MHNRIIPFCFFLFTAGVLPAQTQMFPHLQFPVSANGQNLKFPFAGGLNAPQFSPADLNNDKILDLVVFDRAGDVLLTFINNGTPGQSSYRFEPEYACDFPALKSYVLFRDFDQDGAADIFCSSLTLGTQEMQVYKGYFENNVLKFKPFLFHYPGCTTCNPLSIYYPSTIPGLWNNLYIAETDVPGVGDIDGDGDLDILTFDGLAGGHIWLVENMSVEMGYGLDSLRFRVTDRCWGRFYESGLTECTNCLSPAPDTCVTCFTGPVVVDDRGGAHPGSTVMIYDQDGDGDKEVVLGDVSFNCMNMMTNGGNKDVAWMSAQDDHFPIYDTPVDIPTFPGGYYFDADNDGKGDMVVAPNGKFVNEDRMGVWFYKNTASGNGHTFELKTKRFLTGDMIDLGTATNPALVDIDADGLLDLVVGNQGYYFGGLYQASLYLFRNTGTATSPQFTLEDTDWLGISEFTPDVTDFYPAFGDLDSDGDLDLLVGNNIGDLFYYRNTAGPGNPMLFERDFNLIWILMDVGSYSTPLIADLDSDGLQDILIGERNGNLNFFRNEGTAGNPVFSENPTIEKLGAVDTRVPPFDLGFCAPAIIMQPNGAFLLVTGTYDGHLEAYNNVVASTSPYAVVSPKWGNVDDGNRSAPAFGDLDGDGILEMVTGNLRGGLSLYKTELVDCTVSTQTVAAAGNVQQPRLSPNPARQSVRVDWAVTKAVQWRVFDALGRLVAQEEAPSGTFTIPVNRWPAGAYFINLSSAEGQTGNAVLMVE